MGAGGAVTYPWPVEALVGSDHYITAIGPVGSNTAIACRCGWFAIVNSSERTLDKVRKHMEAR